MAKAWDIRAWTYEADIHCNDCAEKRFGYIALHQEPYAQDSEGNEVHPVFESDEAPAEGEVCGTCGEVISESYEEEV